MLHALVDRSAPRRRARLRREPKTQALSVAVVTSDWAFAAALLAEPTEWAGVVHVRRDPLPRRSAPARALRAALGSTAELVRRELQRRGVPLVSVTPAAFAHKLPIWLELQGVDVALSYKNPLFPDTLVAAPRLGVINLHPSLLPAYRGADPLLAMARDFCLEGGVTAHWMTATPDGGAILGQARALLPEATPAAPTQRALVHELGIPLAQRCLARLARGERLGWEQPAESPTAPARHRTKQAAWEQIDWNGWSLRHLRHYLAQRPFWEPLLPQRTGWRRRVAWTVGDSTLARPEAPPGTILRTPTGYRVTHAEGYVELRPEADLRRLVRGS